MVHELEVRRVLRIARRARLGDVVSVAQHERRAHAVKQHGVVRALRGAVGPVVHIERAQPVIAREGQRLHFARVLRGD